MGNAPPLLANVDVSWRAWRVAVGVWRAD